MSPFYGRFRRVIRSEFRLASFGQALEGRNACADDGRVVSVGSIVGSDHAVIIVSSVSPGQSFAGETAGGESSSGCC